MVHLPPLVFSPYWREEFAALNADPVGSPACATKKTTVKFQCPPPCGFVANDAVRECGPRTTVCCLLCPFTGVGIVWSLTISGEYCCRQLCCCDEEYICACDERRCKPQDGNVNAPQPSSMLRESPLLQPESIDCKGCFDLLFCCTGLLNAIN